LRFTLGRTLICKVEAWVRATWNPFGSVRPIQPNRPCVQVASA
jgi:hypothetical protein